MAYPVDEVYWAYRDHMAEAVMTVPGIKSFTVQSRVDEGDIVRLHNIWHSDGAVPDFAQRFLTEDQQSWDDYAVWFNRDLRCEWNVKPRVFRDAIMMVGTTRFMRDGSTTRIVMTGELSVDTTAVKGIPTAVADTLGPKVEAFIVAKLTPNLELNNLAIGTYLERQRPRISAS